MTVQWKPRIWKGPFLATPQDAESLEKAWGVKLPEDYKQVAMTHQGMTPYPHVLDIGTGNTVISELLTISKCEDDDLRIYSMSETYELIKPHVAPGIYPLASTSAGDFICFDYRRSPDTPKIVFYFTEAAGEGAIYPVADNFTEFLSKLHD
jgi:cell wall assembly regulator SMI1